MARASSSPALLLLCRPVRQNGISGGGHEPGTCSGISGRCMRSRSSRDGMRRDDGTGFPTGMPRWIGSEHAASRTDLHNFSETTIVAIWSNSLRTNPAPDPGGTLYAAPLFSTPRTDSLSGGRVALVARPLCLVRGTALKGTPLRAAAFRCRFAPAAAHHATAAPETRDHGHAAGPAASVPCTRPLHPTRTGRSASRAESPAGKPSF